ncbi:MAG: tetratricopeptide repeat protein [Planctomycetota bacterium]
MAVAMVVSVVVAVAAALPAAEDPDPGVNVLPLAIQPVKINRVAVLQFDVNKDQTDPALIEGLPEAAAAMLRRDLFMVDAISLYPTLDVVKPTDPAEAKTWSVAHALPDANVTIAGSLAPAPHDPTQFELKLRLHRAGRNTLEISYTAKLEEMPSIVREAAGDVLDALDLEPPAAWKTHPPIDGKLLMPLARAYEALSTAAAGNPLTSITATIAAQEAGFKPVLAGAGGQCGFLQMEMARHHPSPDAALEHLKEAVKLDPTLAEAYFLLARNLLDAREPEQALTACQAGLKAAPNFAELMLEMGRAYSQLAQAQPDKHQAFVDSAAQITLEALKLRPQSDGAWNDMGACEYDQGAEHRAQAEACYRYAIKLNPENLDALRNLTYFYAEQASFAQVAKYGAAALKLHPTDDDLASVVGRAEFALGDFDASIKFWQQAIDNAYLGRRMVYYSGLINALRAAGRGKVAQTDMVAFLQRAQAESEDAFELQRMAASEAGIAKRWDKLVESGRAAQFAQEITLLRTLLNNRRYDTARKHIEAAFDLADLPELYDTYVMLLEGSGDAADHKLARSLIGRWRNEYPGDPRACFRQALADKRDGLWQAAADAAADGLKLLPPLTVTDPEKLYPVTTETHAGMEYLAAEAALQLHPAPAKGQSETAAEKQARLDALAHLDAGLKVLVPDCPLARDIQRMKLALQAAAPKS